MVRAERIELSSNAWQALILPLNYARIIWADVTDTIRFYEFHRLGCFHYTKRCIFGTL